MYVCMYVCICGLLELGNRAWMWMDGSVSQLPTCVRIRVRMCVCLSVSVSVSVTVSVSVSVSVPVCLESQRARTGERVRARAGTYIYRVGRGGGYLGHGKECGHVRVRCVAFALCLGASYLGGKNVQYICIAQHTHAHTHTHKGLHTHTCVCVCVLRVLSVSGQHVWGHACGSTYGGTHASCPERERERERLHQETKSITGDGCFWRGFFFHAFVRAVIAVELNVAFIRALTACRALCSQCSASLSLS